MRYMILAILCIGSILWFAIQPVESSWSETDISFTYAIYGLSVVAIVMLFLQKRYISFSVIDTIVCLWFLYVFLRAYFDPTYPCAPFCLRVIQMFTLYIGLRLLFSSTEIPERLIVTGIIICAFYEVIIGAKQIINDSSRHNLYAITGTFLNPGPYSAFLSLGLVMSSQIKKGYWLPVIFAILLPATWSRAALVSTVVCLGIIYWKQIKQWKWTLAIGGFIAITGLYFLKQGSADGRSIIYLISLRCIGNAPMFGSGIGSFCHQYAEEMASFYHQHPSFNYQSADVIESAYNCLLQIGVEQGLIGIGFAIILVILLFIRLSKKGETLKMGLLSLLIFSMFSYPFDQLPYQIIFILITAYAATERREIIFSKWWKTWHQKVLLPVAALGCILVFSNFVLKDIKVREKAESDYKMMAGMTHSAFIDDYYELFPLMTSNKHFLYDFAKMLSFDGRYNDSNAVLHIGTLVSNDPMFYVIQGNNYSEMGLPKDAENAYKKAFSIMPNRLYPLYQLMLLYEKEGDIGKMTEMAQQVIAFKEKIASPATREMKKKTNIIVNQYKINSK